jgi:hypothetical protein
VLDLLDYSCGNVLSGLPYCPYNLSAACQCLLVPLVRIVAGQTQLAMAKRKQQPAETKPKVKANPFLFGEYKPVPLFKGCKTC